MGTGRVENLKPQSMRTKEEQRRIAIQGGVASGEARRAKRTMKELIQIMGSCKAPKKYADKLKETFPDLEDEEIINKTLLIAKQFEKASKGDTKAFEVIRDTGGEKPSDKLEMTGKDGEPLNMKYELAPATKKAIEEQKKEREILDE